MSEQEEVGAGNDNARAEARDAIAAFEEILDVFPNDVGTLDALAQSYHLVGDPRQECHYLKRLVRVQLDQGDVEGAGAHMARLEPLASDDPEALELVGQLRALGFSGTPEPGGDEQTGAYSARAEPRPLADRSDIADAEMALAWTMKEAGVLSDDEYASVVKDLAEITGQAVNLTVSVLHVLQDRTSRSLDPALAFVVQESRRPPAPLDTIDLDDETIRSLPLDTMIGQGIAIFDRIGSEYLVAAMNPLREGLRESIEPLLGHRCHLFVAHPSLFDDWIARVQEALKPAPAPPAT